MAQNTQEQDVQLIQRVVNRDQSALGVLYDLYGSRVYGMAMRVLNNTTLAEEVTQDTFLKLWDHAARWDANRASLATWLLTMTRYTAIDRLRHEKRQSPWTGISIEDQHEYLVDGDPTRLQLDDEHDLATLFESLPPEQVEVIRLSFYEGLSHAEMSELLDTPLGTIKSRVRNGLKRLRGMMVMRHPISSQDND